MILLSQRDPRWANENLGKSHAKVGRYGCTITCLSMLSDYYQAKMNVGSFKTPGNLAHQLNYLEDGRILWPSMEGVLPFKLTSRVRNQRDDDGIRISLKDPKKSVILEVESVHWVVAIKAYPFGVYKVYDPWDGRVRLTTHYKKITGSAHFTI